MEVEDIFSDIAEPTDNPSPTDRDMGNDFVDIDDVNDNDFEGQQAHEQNVGRAGMPGEPGGVDQNRDYGKSTDDPYSYLDLKDEDFHTDDDLGDDFMVPGMEPQTQPQNPQLAQGQRSPESQPAQGQQGQDDGNDQDFIKKFNSKYGKNFQTEKELHDFLSKNETRDAEPENVVTSEEQQRYDQNKGVIKYFSELVQKNDEDVVRMNEQMEFYRKNSRNPNEEEQEEIDDLVDNYKSSGLLRINADHLRTKFENQIDKLKNFNESIDNKVNEVKTAKIKQNQLNLRNSLKDIYLKNNGMILGVKVDKEGLQNAYNDVTSGELMKVMSNPQKAAKLALINRYLDKIEESSMKPGYSAAMNTILQNNNSGRRLGSVQGPAQGSVLDKKRLTADDEFAM